METGICWDAYSKEGLTDEEQIYYIKKYGFSHTFLMSDDKDFDCTVKKIQDAGIIIDTLHLPFFSVNDMWTEDSSGDVFLNLLKSGAYRAGKYGIPYIICHLSSGNNNPRINDAGYKRFKELVDYSESLNVKVCFENQRKIANIAFAFEEYDNAVFCWDTGHEECFANGKRFMPLFGDKLKTLHLHDNFKQPEGDKHLIPYDGLIDYDRVCKSIAESDFDGTVMLEIMRYASDLYDGMSADEYYLKAKNAAEKIASEIERLRNR